MALAFNPFVDPANQLAIDRQRKMADMLMQQSFTPEQGQMVSGHYVAPSITQNLAKLLQGYTSRKINDKADLDQETNWHNQSASLMGILGNNAPAQPAQQAIDPSTATQSMPDASTQTIDPSVPQTINAQPTMPQTTQAPQGQPQVMPQAGNNFKLAQLLKSNAISQLGGDPAAAAYWKSQETPDSIKTADMLGVGRSQQGIDYRGKVTKDNYIPPVAGRPGGLLVYPDGHSVQNPSAIEGSQAVQQSDGSFAYRPMNGATEAITNAASANKAGQNQQTLTPTDQLPVDVSGRPIPRPISATINQANGVQTPMQQAVQTTESGNNPNAVSSAGAQGLMQVMPNTQANPGFGVAPAKNNSPAELQRVGNDYINAMQAKYKDPTLAAIAYNMGPGKTDAWLQSGGDYNKLPNETKSYISQVMTRNAVNSQQPPSQQGVGLALGQKEGAVNSQTELSKKWTDLNTQNSQAQSTSSYLQNIRELANKAAVGPQSDKLVYLNGLLSATGISDKATDTTTANDLLNKYSGQIIARLGSGGMATDAARLILQSAYPTSHMTKDAINEAVGNLVGANEMIKAKTALLSPHATSRDPVAYQQKEQAFDQNADPRLWQYKQLAGTPQGKVMLQGIMKQDPQFLNKMKNLHELGAY